MTRERYARMTNALREKLARLPLGEGLLFVPTFVCALCYAFCLLRLLIGRDQRLLRAVLVPACCFFAATFLRKIIGKERPYDRFGLPPVGRYTPGKRRSLPSRHAASAAAIAFAVIYAYPRPAVAAAMIALCLLISALRVLSGHHDAADVTAALLLSAAVSLAGYAANLPAFPPG